MRRRAELVDETRLRITEAAVLLHTTVGPSNTSISRVAEAAGVTRLTVYRHFADQDRLFAACRAHWVALNPAPDPITWQEIPNLGDRARKALTDTYLWYAEHGDELFPIYRDFDTFPMSTQEAIHRDATAMTSALLFGEASTGVRERSVRAAAGHVLSFWTWRSLMVEQGLSVTEAVDLAIGFLAAATEAGAGPAA
jgi:AcrR family transcriptional regulator